MKIFCRAGIKSVKVESEEARVEKGLKAGARIVSKEDVNGSEDGQDGDKADPERRDVGIGVCEDGD